MRPDPQLAAPGNPHLPPCPCPSATGVKERCEWGGEGVRGRERGSESVLSSLQPVSVSWDEPPRGPARWRHLKQEP